uniref:NADH-ubiquinone oxidoreductase chain 5 n=1 Tax=Helotrephes sp. NKMT027 TaxID=1320099 RepID=C5HIX2_9HEMI|nr:NADH dehydrogenase subunit 5 [Helotrephes sp. NKMT027]ACJ69567.1 NADH dehydrogenase subunit 5 [Helotrephes sp. NKMT027]
MVSLYLLLSFFLLMFGFLGFVFGIYFYMNDYSLMVMWELISVNSCEMSLLFLFDWISLLFSGCVMFISSMVIYYSHTYMFFDSNKVRFLWLVMLFVFSMLLMILSPNMISILIGWDGLGLVSYCLVIYFNNFKSYSAGMLTILTNRIGDVGILLSIAWMMNFGGWYYIYYINFWDKWMVLLCFLIILAGFTKSAQIPFSSWLPAAMAAPTPVSALVHSSTLVTAGVYLLIRFNFLLMNISNYYFFILSLLTMFMAGLGALLEYDLKKVIALSTLSQLGLMMSVIFLGNYTLSFFHLLTHAFFKALLFLCAGLMIHLMSDSQDIRHMGGVLNYIPMTCLCFCISSLSLCGFPFLSGFYSKDLILEVYSLSGSNFFVYLLYYVSIGLTVCYSTRLVYFCMIKGNMIMVCQGFHEDSKMISSMILLLFFSILSGSFFSWLMFSFPIFLVLTFFMKIISLFFIYLGFMMSSELFSVNLNYYYLFGWNFLSKYLSSMWFFVDISTLFFTSSSLMLSSKFNSNIDMGWGESLISLFLFKMMGLISSMYNYLHNNNIKLFMISFIFISFLLFI